MAMAMRAAVLPSSSYSQHSRLSAGATPSGGSSKADYGTQRSSWRGMRMGVVVVPPLSRSVGQTRQSAGVVRAEQAEVATTTDAPEQAEVATTTYAPAETKGGVMEVDKDSFWPIVESAGEKVVVLDMYTQWCGPCKIMLPKVVQLSEKLDDVIFLKLDCNQHNKPLAKELGIRVVPTFKIFKNQKMAGEIKGAKFPELVKLIDKVRTDSQIQ